VTVWITKQRKTFGELFSSFATIHEHDSWTKIFFTEGEQENTTRDTNKDKARSYKATVFRLGIS